MEFQETNRLDYTAKTFGMSQLNRITATQVTPA